jgi:hypothetical protein
MWEDKVETHKDVEEAEEEMLMHQGKGKEEEE